MRTVEEERKLKLNQSIKSSVSSANATMSANQRCQLKNMVSQLASTVDSLRKELTNQKKVSSNRYYNTGTYDRQRCFLCNEIGHLKKILVQGIRISQKTDMVQCHGTDVGHEKSMLRKFVFC